MIPMLYGVAATLIAAGVVAALYGADNIRAESGSAWLQSGATWAASGFLLLAMTAVLSELRKVRRGLADMTLEVQEVPIGAAPPPPAPPPAPAASVPDAPPPPPRLAVPAATAGAAIAAAGLVATAAGPEAPGAGEADMARPAEPQAAAAADAGVAAEAGPDAGPPAIVGSYAAGESTYVMFSDGTIEAELADGRYRFDSTAALRHYLETGEGGLRVEASPGEGAAVTGSAAREP